jgi:AcrR family transcriptional regulator
MSPRRAAALRDADDRTIRELLIVTAARLLEERGAADLTVRAIASEAKVASGVLYNHFADRDELLAHALVRHVDTVMRDGGSPPEPGTATVEKNLAALMRYGLTSLLRLLPAFAGMVGHPGVLTRVHELLARPGQALQFPHLVADYVRAEQRLGRVSTNVSADAVAAVLVGACHEFVLPRVLFAPHAPPPQVPRGYVGSVVGVIMHGIVEPGPRASRG